MQKNSILLSSDLGFALHKIHSCHSGTSDPISKPAKKGRTLNLVSFGLHKIRIFLRRSEFIWSSTIKYSELIEIRLNSAGSLRDISRQSGRRNCFQVLRTFQEAAAHVATEWTVDIWGRTSDIRTFSDEHFRRNRSHFTSL